ncbi:hypothetical protein [Pseudoalteromonas sp. 1181_04]|uniref:hypothetical protein n=1 Tax=Pseudoalteromonas sp. 1181_04 TaxID=2604450 RepID=UPI00406335D5
MNSELVKEYQANIPPTDDFALGRAAYNAVYCIVGKYGEKKIVITNVSRKHKVSAYELKVLIDIAIPSEFFTLRAMKAKKRLEASFHKPEAIKPISESKKEIGKQAISGIREKIANSKNNAS